MRLIGKRARQRASVGVLLFILGIGTLVLVGISSTSSQRSTGDELPSFALFKTPSEALPKRVKAPLAASKLPLELHLAQHLPSVRSWHVWAIPARPYICLLLAKLKELAQSCSLINRVAKRGMFTASISERGKKKRAAQRVVVGLVPDYARRVRVNTPGGAPLDAQANGNFFAAADDVPRIPESLSLIR